MRHLFTLTRMQLGSALDFLKIGRKKDKRKQVSVVGILLVAFLLFSFVSATYSYSMGITMQALGELDVLPGFLMASTCIATIVTSIYKVKGIIFGFKDYDIIMSLPVKTSTVVGSRLLLLYIINMFFTIVIMVPGFAVYGYLARPEFTFYVLALVSVFFVPLIPIVIASIIGIILAVISSRFKYSNAINTILMILFLILIFVGSFFIQSDAQLVQLGTIMRNQMNRTYPLAQLYLQGIVEQDLLSFLYFLGISILAFVLFSITIGAFFKSMNSRIMEKRAGTKFKFKGELQQSSLKALYKKEMKRYLSNGTYVMNTGFGIILLALASIGLFFIKPEQFQMILETKEGLMMVQQLLPFGIAFAVATVSITASSISLEGKNLWIIKSAPLRASEWFMSKMLVQFTITVPAVIVSGILMGIHLKANLLQIVSYIAIPLAYCYLTAVFGLIINLKFPIFDWTSETVVIKSSLASFLGTMCPLVMVGIPLAISFFIGTINYSIIIIVTFVIVLLVASLLHWNLNKNGNKIMAKL